MSIVNFTDFRANVFAWAEENNNRFHQFYPLHGGWEAWVQAEVAAYILNGDSTREIVRESRIYNNNQIADWVLNEQTGGNERIVIELKCQTMADVNGVNFITGINGDRDKLLENNALPNGVKKVLVGIFFSQNALELVNEHYQLNRYNCRELGNGEVGVFVLRDNNGSFI